MVYEWLGSISWLLLVGLMCGFMMPGQPGFNAMFPDVAKLMAEAKADSSATGTKSRTKSGTRQTSPSGVKGVDRRGDLIVGGGTNEGNLGRKTLLGG